MAADSFSARVAARWLQASYFSVGDKVLFGKYKNKVGIIKSFGKDKWGNPTVEVEPVPKGRKQNKVFGLFKIWRADVKEKALAEQAAAGGDKTAVDPDDDDDDDGPLLIQHDPMAVRVAQRCASLGYGYGAQGTELTKQAPFPLVTDCVKCKEPARLAIVIKEDFDKALPADAQMFVTHLHPNNPNGDREGAPGFWLHDCAAFAIYLCTDIDCTTATTLWNQA